MPNNRRFNTAPDLLNCSERFFKRFVRIRPTIPGIGVKPEHFGAVTKVQPLNIKSVMNGLVLHSRAKVDDGLSP